MAEIFDALDQPEQARELRGKAGTLFDRFNAAFWDDDLGIYAYALDGKKRKIRSVVSNPGICLWSGIVPPERAGKVVARLMAPDMWSGWGIRTLSADHPAFNPYSYQTGSVWPHDNGIIALGFKRYGFGAEAGLIARDIINAGSHFIGESDPRTVHHTGAGADVVSHSIYRRERAAGVGGGVGVRIVAGNARPGAGPPRDKLHVDPLLPDWLPDLTLRNLAVGRHRFDIRFRREGEATKFDVLRGDPAAIERSRGNGHFDRLQGWGARKC